MNIITRYIVTAVDYGDTCDGKAGVLGSFKTLADAKEYIKNDIDAWYSHNCENGTIQIDYDDMSAYFSDDYTGCEWQFHEVKIEI